LFLLIVTHDTDFTIKTDRIIEIAEGKTLNQMTKRVSIQRQALINFIRK
jgi:ABC-type lipoprotein export system ATPase subunit